MKLGQGNVFTGVCDSVHRGGSASVHAGIPPPPGPDTPLGADPPWEQTPPQTTPLPLGADPPGKKLTPAYGQ